MEFINIPAWSAREVVEWLKGLDDCLQQYEPKFISQGITGLQLINFSSDFLDKLTVEKVGHQQLFMDAIQHLCHLHYDLCTENLQSVALNLAVKASDLGRYVKARFPGEKHKRKESWQIYPVLTRLSETVSAAKHLIRWLDRPPFQSDKEFQFAREDILHNILSLIQEADKTKLEDTCHELKDFCDNLVKKTHDPLVIQTAYVEIVTLKKKKPDEELGLEIRTTTISGTHVILAANTATPSIRKVNPGDEVLQVNYQTVVGWDHKKVIQALTANPTEVVLTLKKRPKNLTQAGQLVRPSRHTFQTGGLASLPRRKHSNNTLQPPATKDDLYLKTLETQSESENKTPALQSQQSHSDSEPPEPENKLARLHRCPTMGEAVLRRPAAKKSKEATGESRPRSLQLDTLHLDNVSSEDLRHWLERQANESEPHGHSAEQLSPRETPKSKKTVRIQLDLNGNSCDSEKGRGKKKPSKEKRFFSQAEIRLHIPQRSSITVENQMADGTGTDKGGLKLTSSDGGRGTGGENEAVPHEEKDAEVRKVDDAVVKRKDLSNVRDTSKTSSGSSSDGFIIWEEVEEENKPQEAASPTVRFQERAIDVPDDFVPQPKYRINPNYQDSSKVVRRSPKVKKARKKARISRRITCVDLGPGSCEGWLNKRNDNLTKSWVSMFFKLKDFVLYYYKHKEAEKAKGVICLPGYNVQSWEKKKWCIKISHRSLDKSLYLEAEKEADWRKWMEHLQLATILFKNEEDVRKSMVFSDNISMLSTVMEDITGYHSESEDENDKNSPVPHRSSATSGVPDRPSVTSPSPLIIVNDVDQQEDKFATNIVDIVPETPVFRQLARRSTRRKQNARKIYKTQTELHPDQKINDKLVTKQLLHRTIEAKKKDVEELDKLLAQKIDAGTFRTWQRDHPNLLQEIKRTRVPSREDREYSSEEEGSIVSTGSDLGAVGASPSTPRKTRGSPSKTSSGSEDDKKKMIVKLDRGRNRTESETSETSL